MRELVPWLLFGAALFFFILDEIWIYVLKKELDSHKENDILFEEDNAEER